MGLDQYLLKIKKKCNSNEELKKIKEIRSVFENKDKLKYYDEVNAGKYENYLNNEFYENFAKYVKIGFILKENDAPNMPEDEKKLALDTADKFLNIYVPKLQSAVKFYKEAIANGEIEENYNSIEIGYWRKHSDLQGYMKKIYEDRGGQGDFNCVDLILSKEDCEAVIEHSKQTLQDLSKGIEAKHTTGFFFGQTEERDWIKTIDIFERVLETTDWNNETVYYSSWW